MLGFNLAQLDGANFSGFDKTGISGGLRVATVFNERLDFMVEMIYSQTGSKLKDDGRPQDFSSKVKPVHMRLNFVEVPSISDRTVNYAEISEDFNKNPLGIIFGLKYNLDENFGIAFRHTIAAIPSLLLLFP